LKKKEIFEYCLGMFDFRLVSYQLDFMFDCLNRSRVVAVFCRQSGKTETVSKVAIMLARRIVDNPVLIFAPTDRQAGLLALKIENSVKKMPFLEHFRIVRQTLRSFYFSNGGSIICETVGDTGQTILGYTAGAIILEEAGSIKDSIVYGSILPMGATTDPPIIKIGTPKGMNHFFESFDSDLYCVHQISYEAAVRAGVISAAYVEEMRRTLPSDKFRTEMMAEFVVDEDAYFPYSLIESCVGGVFRDGPVGGGVYYLGADIARLGQDSTCLIVLERGSPNRVVKIVDIPKCTLDVAIDRINELHSVWGFKKIFVDETGVGAGVRDVLARRYNVWKRNVFGGRRGFVDADLVVGVRFTIQNKMDIYSNLKVLMERGLLKFPRDRKLISQLRDFRYELTVGDNVKLHHSEYGFDDYCDALALAVQGCRETGFAFGFAGG